MDGYCWTVAARKRSDEDQFLLFNLLPYELGKFKEVERILILIAEKRLL